MKILVINGNTKKGGFTSDALSIISSYLESQAIEVQNIRLCDANIKDCIGCFHCLRTGNCVLKDDLVDIIQAMLQADGFVIGSPVRNGLITACYKRFYERITYTLGFTLLLEDKYTLAISSVGYLGGKKVNKNLLGLQDLFHTTLSDFIFCKVGIPPKMTADDVRIRLENGVKKFVLDINKRSSKGFVKQMLLYVERIIMKKIMFEKNPEQYANVLKCWREKGYL